jgi:hypothetical protein
MRFISSLPVRLVRLAVLFFAVACLTNFAAQAADMKFEAFLIWATDAGQSPDPNHKPCDAEVRKKLNDLPLKWKNYFVVNSVKFSVSRGGSQEATLSDKCKIEVKHIDGKNIEVSLIGKGKPTVKVPQPLPKGDMLVLGGNAPDSTGWLVALKRIE